MLMDTFSLKQCDIQGRIFENSVDEGYDSEEFIRHFMNSQTAAYLDLPVDHMQWAGEAYVMAELKDEAAGKLSKTGIQYSRDTMHWIGYLYRYWHYLKNEKSSEIYKVADAEVMSMVYPAFHTLSCEMAIEDLIAAAEQKS